MDVVTLVADRTESDAEREGGVERVRGLLVLLRLILRDREGGIDDSEVARLLARSSEVRTRESEGAWVWPWLDGG